MSPILSQAPETDKKEFIGRLTHLKGEKLTQFSINNETDAKQAETDLNKSANGQLKVAKVDKKQRKRRPSPPFTTSTLQQEAARKIGFTARRTMSTAQQLYEGIELDGERIGAHHLYAYRCCKFISRCGD